MLTAFRAGWAADGAFLRDRFGWRWDGQARIERGDAGGAGAVRAVGDKGQCGAVEHRGAGQPQEPWSDLGSARAINK